MNKVHKSCKKSCQSVRSISRLPSRNIDKVLTTSICQVYLRLLESIVQNKSVCSPLRVLIMLGSEQPHISLDDELPPEFEHEIYWKNHPYLEFPAHPLKKSTLQGGLL